ncbi:MAG: hypothetical protein DME59_08020 [Verrucomicrobia bacterium]|nr:MAG: hypothetical protein DME59_08020 [Verrucomicrobiota bacterium]PYL77718.1 MAG: hypothetical protein DMF26_03155 [Verrucomicrobiota bacterium]
MTRSVARLRELHLTLVIPSEVGEPLDLFPKNRLYFGDNLGWLSNRKDFPDASADLVYLDRSTVRTWVCSTALNASTRRLRLT